MANVVVSVEKPISDGNKLKFRTPCDSTTIECLEVKYPAKNGVGTLIKKFVFKDAHGTELSGVGNLFVSGVMIEVLLDVTHSVAYIQNADTNSYIERVKSDIERLEESQRQFLEAAGKTVEECENIANSAEGFARAMEDATRRAESVQGVYVGAGPMPEGYSVQIDPTGDALVMESTIKSDSENPVESKAIYSALEKKADVSTTVYTYKSLNVLGITEGDTSGEKAETIDNIVGKMQQNTMLLYSVGGGNAKIYPQTPAYGLVRVTYLDTSRALFEYTSKSSGASWVGFYAVSNDPKWTGWVRTATSGDITNLSKEIEVIKGDIAVIQSSNGTSDNALASIIDSVAVLEGKVSRLESNTDVTDKAVDAVIGDVDVLKKRVQALETKVAGLG